MSVVSVDVMHSRAEQSPDWIETERGARKGLEAG